MLFSIIVVLIYIFTDSEIFPFHHMLVSINIHCLFDDKSFTVLGPIPEPKNRKRKDYGENK